MPDDTAARDAAYLRERLADFDRAVSTRDIDGMLALFADDAIIYGPAQAPITGGDAIRSWWTDILDRFEVSGIHEIDDVSTVGDVVVLLGTGRGTLTPRAGGARVPIDNWIVHVYRREPDGALRYWRGAFGPAASGDRVLGARVEGAR